MGWVGMAIVSKLSGREIGQKEQKLSLGASYTKHYGLVIYGENYKLQALAILPF
jgi:hypothetical protein